MTLQVVASCDGTPAERDSIAHGHHCLAFLPTGQVRVIRALAVLDDAGWALHGGKLLCPACTRARLSA